MKWACLLGSPRISGGTYVIFEHAIRAQRRGIDVCVVMDTPLDPADIRWHADARELTWRTYKDVSQEVFDVAIATWWPTAYNLPRIRAKNYCYFVQSIESRFYGADDRLLSDFAEATYRLPLSVVTEATWIRDYLQTRYGRSVELVRNGIRKDTYKLADDRHAPRRDGRLRVLVEGSLDSPFKNVKRTIELCRQSEADEVWLLTPTPVAGFEGVDRVFSNVPIHETPPIYRSCDVLVKLSYVEGMFGPPLEMFHCGGTSIVYDVTGHDEYIRHDENAIVCRTDDEESVVEWINRLRSDRALLDRLCRGARATADAWPDWEVSSSLFADAIGRISSAGACPRERLIEHAPELIEWFLHLSAQQQDAIAGQTRLIEERWAAMQDMDCMIHERDQALAAQARLIDERWAAMQEMERMIQERDSQIAELRRLLHLDKGETGTRLGAVRYLARVIGGRRRISSDA